MFKVSLVSILALLAKANKPFLADKQDLAVKTDDVNSVFCQ